jgi:hypothetical protein
MEVAAGEAFFATKLHTRPVVSKPRKYAWSGKFKELRAELELPSPGEHENLRQ